MTEKRFKLSYPNGAFLIDGDEPLCHMKNDLMIIDLLNEQHERITDLTDRLGVASNREIQKDNLIERLQKENEQLKSELKNCKECLDLNRESCARHMKENEQLKQEKLILKGKLHRLRMEKGALEKKTECLNEETVEQFRQDLKNGKFIEYTAR